MKIHETPKEVASTLARWAPRHISCLLDPSVGNGALIAPLIPRLQNNKSLVYCVDINQEALQTVKEKHGRNFGSSMVLVNNNFLEVNFDKYLKGEGYFDCVVMNPPFAGKRNHLAKVNMLKCKSSMSSFDRKAPLEAVFLMRAVQLVKPGGRVLAVLPSSVIASNTTKWIREFLLDNGSVLCVHELPPFTFEKVEARIYLLVFEKGFSNRRIVLRNHKLVRPDEILLTRSSIGDNKRLDYGFQISKLRFDALRSVTPKAGWSFLSTYAKLKRGQAESPRGIKKAIHTTDYCEGFWLLNRLKSKSSAMQLNDGLKHTDLLVTRVGRRSTDSIGTIIGSASLACTDCIIRIRLKKGQSHIRLLFALRCLLVCEEGRSFIQRGSSAKYIVPSEVESLLIPWNLADMYPKVFSKYKAAVARHQFHHMRHFENFVQSMLRKRLESHCWGKG